MDSRTAIFQKLSQKKPSFALSRAELEYKHVVPDTSDSPDELLARFIREAEKLSCTIHQVANEKEAIDEILALVKDEKRVLGWSFEQIGLAHLEEAFAENEIDLDETENPEVRYGITGVETALAATGSIVLASGAGKSRAASLLPPIHIAVLRRNQIIPDLESWVAQKPDFQDVSNLFLVSGPSKTADIAMELVMGMHGPQALQIVLISV